VDLNLLDSRNTETPRNKSNIMRIREAQPADAEQLTQIAQDAKRYWGYPEHWLEHWRDDLTITPDFVIQNEVYVAEEQGELLGFYGLVSKEGTAELDHLWVSPTYIGRGVGKELFLHAMQIASTRNFTNVHIVADPNAEAFYQKMGASRVGESVSEIDGKPRVLPRLEIDPRDRSESQ
jgi:N-acetylglutamate synthase-like GNAT family acetyltransferase